MSLLRPLFLVHTCCTTGFGAPPVFSRQSPAQVPIHTRPRLSVSKELIRPGIPSAWVKAKGASQSLSLYKVWSEVDQIAPEASSVMAGTVESSPGVGFNDTRSREDSLADGRCSTNKPVDDPRQIRRRLSWNRAVT